MENSEYQFCPRCGEKLNESKNFCPKCGFKFTTDNIVERLVPNSEKILGVKQFIINNFRMMHIVYLIVFLAGLMSVKLGLLCLIVVILAVYVISVLRGNKQIFESDEDPEEEQVNNPDYHSYHDEEQPIKVQEKIVTPIKHEEMANTKPNQQETLTTNTISTSRSEFGMLEILLIVSSVMSLFGVIIKGFFKISDASLFKSLIDVSSFVGYAENAETIMTGSSSNHAMLIQLIGYLLIVMPIFILIMGLLKSRLAKTFSCLGALLEVIFIIYCITKLVHIYKQVPQFVVRHVPNILGTPAYILIVGVCIMAMTSIVMWTKKIVSEGTKIE